MYFDIKENARIQNPSLQPSNNTLVQIYDAKPYRIFFSRCNIYQKCTMCINKSHYTQRQATRGIYE